MQKVIAYLKTLKQPKKEETTLVINQPTPLSVQRSTVLNSALAINDVLAKLTGDVISKTGLSLDKTGIMILNKVLQLALNLKNQTLKLPLDHRTELYHQLTTNKTVQSCTSDWLEPFLCSNQGKNYLHARRADMPFEATPLHYTYAVVDLVLTSLCLKSCAEDAALLPTAWTLHEIGASVPLRELLKELTWKSTQQTPVLDTLIERSLGKLLDQDRVSYKVIKPWIKEVFRAVLQNNIQTITSSKDGLVAHHADGSQTTYQVLEGNVVNARTYKGDTLTHESFHFNGQTIASNLPATIAYKQHQDILAAVLKLQIEDTFQETFSTQECLDLIRGFKPDENGIVENYLTGIMDALIWNHEDQKFKAEILTEVTQPETGGPGVIFRDNDGIRYSPSYKMSILSNAITLHFKFMKGDTLSEDEKKLHRDSFFEVHGFTLDQKTRNGIQVIREDLSKSRNNMYPSAKTTSDDSIIDFDFGILFAQSVIPHFMHLAGKVDDPKDKVPDTLAQLIPKIQENFLNISNKRNRGAVKHPTETVSGLEIIFKAFNNFSIKVPSKTPNIKKQSQSPSGLTRKSIKVPSKTPNIKKQSQSPSELTRKYLHNYSPTPYVTPVDDTTDSPAHNCRRAIIALREDIIAFNASLTTLAQTTEIQLKPLDLSTLEALETDYNEKATGSDIPLQVMLIDDIGSIPKTEKEYRNQVQELFTQVEFLTTRKKEHLFKTQDTLKGIGKALTHAYQQQKAKEKSKAAARSSHLPEKPTATPIKPKKDVTPQPKQLSSDIKKQAGTHFKNLLKLVNTLDASATEQNTLDRVSHFLDEMKQTLLTLQTEGDFLNFQHNLRSSGYWSDCVSSLYPKENNEKLHTALEIELKSLQSGKPTADTSLFKGFTTLITHIKLARQLTACKNITITEPQLPEPIRKSPNVKLPEEISELTRELHNDLKELSLQHNRLVDEFTRAQKDLDKLSKQSPPDWIACQKAATLVENSHDSLHDLADGIQHSDLAERRQTLQNATDAYIKDKKAAHHAQAQQQLHLKRYQADLERIINQFNKGESDLTLEDIAEKIHELDQKEGLNDDIKGTLIDQLTRIQRHLENHQEQRIAQSTLKELSDQLDGTTCDTREGQLATRFLLGQIVSLLAKPNLVWDTSMLPETTEQFIYWRDALLKDPHHIPLQVLENVKSIIGELAQTDPWDSKLNDLIKILTDYTSQYLRISQNPKSVYWVSARLSRDEQELDPICQREITQLATTTTQYPVLAMLVILKDVTDGTPKTHELRNRLAHQVTPEQAELQSCFSQSRCSRRA